MFCMEFVPEYQLWYYYDHCMDAESLQSDVLLQFIRHVWT